LGRSVEFDGIANDGKKLLIAETKRTKNPRGLKDLKHLEESASLKMFSSFNKPDYYLISYNGFAEDLKSYDDKHVHLISLEEMF
jgi:hypothetical protein